MKNTSNSLTALALVFALAACSPSPEEPVATLNMAEAPPTEDPSPASAPAPLVKRDEGEAMPGEPAPESRTLGLAGLGDLRIGEPVPTGGSWATRGAQTEGACRSVTSPGYPGVYAIVSDGRVQRITVGQHSSVKVEEGVGTGSTEAEVKKWFAGFREEPHQYQDAPGKYLTAPNAGGGSSALRFEIGADGKVSLMHVGVMPVLAYVEGCG